MKPVTPRNFNLVKKVAGEGCLTGVPKTFHLISLSPNKETDVEKEHWVENLETRVALELYHRAVCDPGQLTSRLRASAPFTPQEMKHPRQYKST